jgi:hypothetical protein
MAQPQFAKGDRVKIKGSDRRGTVEYCSTEATTNMPYCQVKFDDGETARIAEKDLQRA